MLIGRLGKCGVFKNGMMAGGKEMQEGRGSREAKRKDRKKIQCKMENVVQLELLGCRLSKQKLIFSVFFSLPSLSPVLLCVCYAVYVQYQFNEFNF